MKELSFIYRTELYHAISVHFPIALLIISNFLTLISVLLPKKTISEKIRFSASLTLWIGLISFCISYYTGRKSYPIVVRNICDPTVLKNHLYWVYVSACTFFIALLFDVTYNIIKFHKYKSIINLICLCTLILGTIILTYTSHLGASVVYEQAGGVNVPSKDCENF